MKTMFLVKGTSQMGKSQSKKELGKESWLHFCHYSLE